MSKWADAMQGAKRFLMRRKAAYDRTFRTEDGEDVLRDLARFCRAHSTTFNPDARTAAILEGRREVWLRIQEHLRLSEDELWELRRPQASGTQTIVQNSSEDTA